MNDNLTQSRELVLKAREALRRNDKETARLLGEQAALLAPESEDPWLILAASDSNPEDALTYARKAEENNPRSPRARRAVEWAEEKLNQASALRDSKRQGETKRVAPIRSDAPARIPIIRESKPVQPKEESKPRGRLLLYGATFGLLACIVIAFAAWSTAPAFASVLNAAPQPTQENLWARVDIAKPSAAPAQLTAFVQAPATATPIPGLPTTTLEPVSTPTFVPTEAPAILAATETPAALAMDLVLDTPTSEYIPPTTAPTAVVANNEQPSYPAQGNGERWIDVDLTNQMVYAYEGDVIVNSFLVSTGTAYTPTVTGKFKIWIKLKKTNMSGPGYFLPDVPYTMYFYKGYGLHGTYWHSNFVTPMSHGCVNMRTEDAKWLFQWALPPHQLGRTFNRGFGTLVQIHY